MFIHTIVRISVPHSIALHYGASSLRPIQQAYKLVIISFMAVRATFTAGFGPYRLIGVRVTDRELGRGSYATVLELEYMGLKCAGKMIHELLLEQGDASYSVHRFEEECRLLSQIRHPNIVQFLHGSLFPARSARTHPGHGVSTNQPHLLH
jgi:hypothetical protein